MRVFRRIMLSSRIDIESLPDTQKLYYKAPSKVSPNSGSLGADVIFNKWNSITGEGVVVCSSDITTINDRAFYGRTSLESVTIPNGVTSIGNYAFSDCTGLTSIIIPEGVTTIGENAFYYCESLISITIPNSVTNIGGDAFYECTSMQYYDFSTHELVPTISYGAFARIPSTCKIIVPDALYDEWIVATIWSTYASHIIKKSDWDAL